ncbi:MAG TPA: SCO family protein [Blastocatellia bacterium]|nr:SCO family protein [Blastocatellia bacterium]
MADNARRKLLVTLGAAPFAGSLVPKVEASGLDKPLHRVSVKTPRQELQEKLLPNVELTTHEGKKVRFYDDLVKDRIVVINFMYAECTGICPGITANLINVQKTLGDRVGRDIFMYSVTLRPEKDSPKELDHYVKMHGIKPGWQFLTGKPRDVELLRRSLGFYDGNEELDKDQTNHIGMVRYGNEPRQWWAMCPGQAKPAWIVRSILWMDKPLYVKPENKSGNTPSQASDKGGQK